MQRAGKADRAGRYGVHAARAGPTKEQPARCDVEEIDTVDDRDGALEETIDVVLGDPLGKSSKCCGRVDRTHHLGHDVDLEAVERRRGGPRLAVHVTQLEAIAVGERESPNTQPRQGKRVTAAHSA